MTKATAEWPALLFFACACAVFLLTPGVDLAVSGWFFQPPDRFPLAATTWAQVFYVGSPWLVKGWLGALVIMAGVSLWDRFRRWRRDVLFLLTVICLGPGLVVTILKDHWDRARPVQIVEFGGDRQFTPAWVISDQCEDNCSFVSGHASGAFSLMALAWVLPRQRRFWLVTGLLWGGHMGLVRIAQGGHFLSDVVFAGFVVYFTAALLSRWVFYRAPGRSLFA